MSEMDAVERFLEDEAKLATEIASRGGEPAWLSERRGEGRACFSALGFPTTRHEQWRYTPLKELLSQSFECVGPEGSAFADEMVQEHRMPGALCVVLVDGSYHRELSDPIPSSFGADIEGINEWVARDADAASEVVAKVASHEERALVALNTALFRDGVAVNIPANSVVEQPIQLLHLMTAEERPAQAHLRHVIRLGRSAEATILETYVGRVGQPYFQNVVTEVVLGDNAKLDRYKLEQESGRAFHLALFEARLGRDSQLRTHCFSWGAKLSRNEMAVRLAEPGAECLVAGIYYGHGDHTVDHHIEVEHQKPNCRSKQLLKGILADRSRGVFDGKVIVQEKATGTDAQQQNSNLLLSETAVINTKPQLEIFNDDVTCSHGATVGQLDEDALFYLRARGIGHSQARQMLIAAFAMEVADGCRLMPLKVRLNELFTEELS